MCREAAGGDELRKLAVVAIELGELALQVLREALLNVQHAVTGAEEKARRAQVGRLARAQARGRGPVDHALGFRVLVHLDELQSLEVRIGVVAHAEVAQHGVGGAAGHARGLSVPQRQQQAGAAHQRVGEVRVHGVALRGGLCLCRAGRPRGIARQLDAAYLWVLQQLLQALERLRIEVGRVLGQRHRQQCLDADTESESGLGDQQIGARGHADQQSQLGVRQARLQLAHKVGDCLAQPRQIRRIKVAVS